MCVCIHTRIHTHTHTYTRTTPVSVPPRMAHLLNCQELPVLDVLGLQPVTEGELNTALHMGGLRLKGEARGSLGSGSCRTGSWVFLSVISISI